MADFAEVSSAIKRSIAAVVVAVEGSVGYSVDQLKFVVVQ